MKKSILLFVVINSFWFLSSISYAQDPNWSWAKSAGGFGYDAGNVVEADKAGNVFVTGYFSSATITFGAFTLTNAGDGHSDMFLAKYNLAGDVLWAKSSGAIGKDHGNWVCPNQNGSVYETGTFYGNSITFGSTVLNNINSSTDTTSDIFLVKYDVNGNVVWAKSFGGIYSDDVLCMSAKFGYIYIVGSFNSPTLAFGSTTLTNIDNTGKTDDLFLAILDTNGNVLWAKSTGGTGDDWGNEVSIDGTGNIYIEGEFNSATINFGSTILTNADNTGISDDSFLVKYDADGNVIWAKIISGSAYDDAVTVGVDPLGNAYIAGMFNSPTLNFGSTTLTNAGNWDMFLAKYDASGNVLWAKSVGGINYDQACHLNVDIHGNVSIIGAFYSPNLTFGSTTLINTDNTGNTEDTYVVQYDAYGNVKWATSVGGNGNDWGVGCCTDEYGNVYASGYFYSPTIPFGSNTLVNADNSGSTYDMFIAKLGNNTGINELGTSATISIFPNPSTDQLTIKTLSTPTQSQLSIINSTGQEIISQQVNEPKTTINISTLPSGVYFVRLTKEKTVEIGKFIKQ